MELGFLKPHIMKVVIISRGRSETITSDKLFPTATLCVPESEVELYENVENEIEPYPDEIKGLGRLRNWVLDTFNEKCIVMCDDDITKLWCMSSKNGYKIIDPDKIYQILENTAVCAMDLDVGVFAFNQLWDLRKYNCTDPFSLRGWGGGVVGIIGREFRFIDNMFKVDVDYFLQNLLEKRIVWIDQRYSFVQGRDKNKGGNSLYRTNEKVDAEIKMLKNKWGKHFIHKRTATGEETKINVRRKSEQL